MENNKLSMLPNTWAWIQLSDAINPVNINKNKVKKKNYLEKGNLPVIDQGIDKIGGYTNDLEKQVKCDPPVIIFGDHTRNFKYVDFKFVAGADGIKVLKPKEFFNEKLFYYFVHVLKLPNKGYARHYQYLKKAVIPVPPFNEQIRIVGRVEELFSRLDAGVRSLQAAQTQLEQYRQATLQQAYTEKHYEKGQNGWKNKSIQDVAELISGQHIMKKDYNIEQRGEPYLTGPDDFGEINPIISKWTTNPKVYAKKNDILITVKGAGVGKINILDLEKVVISRQLMAIRGISINPKYIYYYLEGIFYRLQKLGSGSTVPGIRREQILEYEIPIAPNDEINKIIEKIEYQLSIIHQIKNQIRLYLKKTTQLKHAILKKAFEGKLVIQDPNDEPASVLLERIKTQKTKQRRLT